MKVFIFGAGASKGSQGDNYQGLACPLTDELFNKEYLPYAKYSKTGYYEYEILPETEFFICSNESKKADSVEKWLTQRWNNINKYTQSKSQNAERVFFSRVTFYIWKLLQTISRDYKTSNAYTVLMDKLRISDKPFGMISFNYDTLLEKAINDTFGETFTSLEGYFDFNFIKPHGSVNWILSKRNDDPPTPQEVNLDIPVKLRYAVRNMLLKDTLPLSELKVYEPNQAALNNIAELLQIYSGQYFYPLIFMPLTSKLYRYAKTFMESITLEGKKLLQQATEIYLIGYNAKDDIIKDFLIEAPKDTPLHVVKHKIGSSKITMDEVLSWAQNLRRGGEFDVGFKQFAEGYTNV